MNRNKLIKSYLIYTGGIFLGIIALYWIQYNLFPTPDIPTGLGVAEFSLIGGIAFWIERTIKLIMKLSKNASNNSNNTEPPKKVVDKSKVSDGEQVVRNFSTVILIILAIMLLVNLVSI